MEFTSEHTVVKQNPERPAPPEILSKIVALDVTYLDFNGETREGTIEIHEDLARDVADFFHNAYQTRFPIERVVRSSDVEFAWDDNKLMAANASSGYNYRLIKNTDVPSWHGKGRAFDVNTALNPFIGYNPDGSVQFSDPPGAEWNPEVPGTLTHDHPLVQFMIGRGWIWGGDWTTGRVDYQHFEMPETEPTQAV